jgi:dGTPase
MIKFQFMKTQENLYKEASYSDDHLRWEKEDDNELLPYRTDIERIIHSKAYARYVDKTQVVYLVENDHITHRSLHVQLVSSFARGIAQQLKLNVDLVEAISLGHDVGHPPFGHEGEGYLSSLSEEYGNGPFAHPWQSCRLFSQIEPLNLGLAVYDGFLCHDGGITNPIQNPRFNKTWEDHFQDKQLKISQPDTPLSPGTLEGCLVKVCDTISYLSRDIEDAISLGILTRADIPKTCLGNSNHEILKCVGQDIFKNSLGQNHIVISQEVFESLQILREFNFEKIYIDPRLKVESEKICRSYRYLFEWLLKDYEEYSKKSFLWQSYLISKNEAYLATTGNVQAVVDYISGMTDHFFVRTLEKILVPKKIEWN